MGIAKWRFNNHGRRNEVAAEIAASTPGGRPTVIDCGGATSSFDHLLEMDMCIDLVPPAATFNNYEVGDLNDEQLYRELVDYYRLYDWCICTHTLEDLMNPLAPLKWMPKIADRGYIAVPSAHHDTAQLFDTGLGFPHHRHLFTVESTPDGDRLVVWPKIPMLCADKFKEPVERFSKTGLERGDQELEIFWEGDLPFRVVHLGPTISHMVDAYMHELLGVPR